MHIDYNLLINIYPGLPFQYPLEVMELPELRLRLLLGCRGCPRRGSPDDVADDVTADTADDGTAKDSSKSFLSICSERVSTFSGNGAKYCAGSFLSVSSERLSSSASSSCDLPSSSPERTETRTACTAANVARLCRSRRYLGRT